ncbi:MAG: ATP-binding protein [Candidatus Staskawiczbacteria bacterium]|nr:ATP-binding protein [Candidatus Staskawiczbacteria bacterium]
MDLHLLIHNIGFIVGAAIGLSMGIFVLSRNPRRPLNILFFLTAFSTVVFQVSHIIGTNITDPYLSRNVLMFNAVNLFIVVFLFHFTAVYTNRSHELRWQITCSYAFGAILLAIYLIFPDTFLLPSVSKMYLPNYYVPGSLHFVMRIFSNILMPAYIAYFCLREIFTTNDPILRVRLKYFLFIHSYAFVLGSLAVLLVYNIQFDPAWAALCGLYPIPFAYVIFKYEFLDIKIYSKRAIGYAFAVGLLAFLIGSVQIANKYLSTRYSDFSPLFVYLISAVIAVTIGVLVWKRARESDLAKFEFVDIVTHKFRTPLTRINWSIETLRQREKFFNDDERHAIEAIMRSTTQLVELTNMLVALDESEKNPLFHNEKISMPKIAEDIVLSCQSEAQKKGVKLSIKEDVTPPDIFIDKKQIHFILGVLIDNALIYTPSGREITITIKKEGRTVACNVKDEGIGISKDDQNHIFSKFYRAKNARHTYTEGSGVGLYVARALAKRNGGNIFFKSEGEGKGTTFTLKLPAAKG